MNKKELAVRPDISPKAVELMEKAGSYARKSKNPGTVRAYSKDFDHFKAFCKREGRPSLPADPATVVMYLVELADKGYKPSTLNRRLASISVTHKKNGHSSPPTKHEGVREVLEGIQRDKSVAQTKKAPVRIEHLRKAFADAPLCLRGRRDKALVLIGYAGGFRRSELVALDVTDLDFRPEGVVITVRRSKTDQRGEGQSKAIHYGRCRETCPVHALRDWLTAGNVQEGKVFRSIDRHGKVRESLSDKAVATIIKGMAPRFGLDPDAIGGHSLRAGLVTDAFANGASESDVMRQTGHKSRNVLDGYRREANLFRQNVTKVVGL